MKVNRKKYAIIAGICIIAGILIAMVGISLGAGSSVYIDSKLRVHVNENIENYVYDSESYTGIENIYVNMRDMNIRIEESKDNSFSVHIEGDCLNEPSVTIDNREINISDGNQSGFRWLSLNFDFRNIFNSKNMVIVYVPQNCNLSSIDLKTSDGDITVESNINVSNVNIKSSSGNILLSDLSCNEETYLKTSDGDITLKGTFKGEIQAKSSSGNVNAEGTLTGEVSLKTSDGDISLQTNTLRSTSEFAASTSDGKITINEQTVGNKFNEDNGDVNEYQLKTSSGNISIIIK